MKHVTTFLLLLLLCGRASAATELPLRLLLTSDLHMQLLDHDDLSDRPIEHYSLARTASLIRAARREQPNSLLFDNGDLLQGGTMGDWLASRRPAPPKHPAYTALEALGYDAANLGNHDFDFGLPFMRRAIAASRVPVINANLLSSKSAQAAFRPALLLRRQFRDTLGRAHSLRIGVIGLAPPQTLLWNRAVLGDALRAQGQLEAAQQWVPKLRRQGADLIVVVAHTGIGSNAENAALLLAQVPGVDALLLGHAHGEFPGAAGRGQAGVDADAGTLHGVPALMPGRWGDHLGVLDLRLRKTAGRWRVVQSQAALRAVRPAGGSAVPADEQLRAQLLPLHAPVREWVNTPLAESLQPLHGHFAQWQPSRLVALIQAAQRDWLQARLAGNRWAQLPLLSAAAPMRVSHPSRPDAGTDIPAGPLRLRHLSDLYPYSNTVKLLRLNGAELREWLERAAAQFRQLDPAGPAAQPLLEPEHPGYNFDQIDGIEYAYDLSQPSRYAPDGQLVQPAASRVVELRWQGRPVRDEDWFLLATNSFRAAGGGAYPRLPEDRMVLDLADETRQLLADYVRKHPLLDIELPSNWSLRLPPGIEAELQLAPTAVTHLRELSGQHQLDEASQPKRLRWRP
jgi:2',3'-cyclic-nucleotide 2'-phosphodiesterase/3'-nucleotidase